MRGWCNAEGMGALHDLKTGYMAASLTECCGAGADVETICCMVLKTMYDPSISGLVLACAGVMFMATCTSGVRHVVLCLFLGGLSFFFMFIGMYFVALPSDYNSSVSIYFSCLKMFAYHVLGPQSHFLVIDLAVSPIGHVHR
jgi:hypothetical protein